MDQEIVLKNLEVWKSFDLTLYDLANEYLRASNKEERANNIQVIQEDFDQSYLNEPYIYCEIGNYEDPESCIFPLRWMWEENWHAELPEVERKKKDWNWIERQKERQRVLNFWNSLGRDMQNYYKSISPYYRFSEEELRTRKVNEVRKSFQ